MPNMRVFMQNNRLSGASNDLLGSFQLGAKWRRSNGRKERCRLREQRPHSR